MLPSELISQLAAEKSFAVVRSLRPRFAQRRDDMLIWVSAVAPNGTNIAEPR